MQQENSQQAIVNLNEFKWVHSPQNITLTESSLEFLTEPGTDFWQRTYYGFRNDNSPAFLRPFTGDFSFWVKTEYSGKVLFDQCGIAMYQDSDNWLKASVERGDTQFSQLGAVVTNLGYSDWSTENIPTKDTQTVWYRLSRMGQDFLMEASFDGVNYNQMRICHMHKPVLEANVGVYACSPQNSSFSAKFSDFKITDSIWKKHQV